MAKLAAILIRGLIGSRAESRDALDSLRLRRKHALVILDDTPENRGTLKRGKDYITYGPVSEETLAELQKARKPLHEGARTVYSLAPPRGGFERQGIKKGVSEGGALGARKEMDSLIKRML